MSNDNDIAQVRRAMIGCSRHDVFAECWDDDDIAETIARTGSAEAAIVAIEDELLRPVVLVFR